MIVSKGITVRNAGSYLVANSTIGHVVARLNLAHVHHNAQKVIGTRSLEFHVLPAIPAAGAVGVRQHVQLQREMNDVVNLRRRSVMLPLLKLESLRGHK